jgi:hypothetical protein
MRSSLRVIDAKSGEILGRVSRTGEEEIARLSFSHNELIQIRGSVPQDAESYRVELWVGEEGGEFKAVVLDVFNVSGVYDGGDDETSYDITAYGTFLSASPCFLFDKGEYFDEGRIEKDGSDYYCVFEGDTTNYIPCLVYFVEGMKGFLSVPVVGDDVYVNQETGDREVTMRYFTEGDDV